jgi:hypothetical protein
MIDVAHISEQLGPQVTDDTERGIVLKMTAFWDTAPCSLVEIDRYFRGAYCLHY